jgi:putative flippase GtrA
VITRSTFGRSVLTSIFSTAVDYGVLNALYYVLGVDYRIATFIASTVGFLTNFTLNRYWAFEARGGALHWQLVRGLPIQAGSTALQVLGMQLFVGGFGIAVAISKLIVSALVYLVWNYPMNRHFVFGRKIATLETPVGPDASRAR